MAPVIHGPEIDGPGEKWPGNSHTVNVIDRLLSELAACLGCKTVKFELFSRNFSSIE